MPSIEVPLIKPIAVSSFATRPSHAKSPPKLAAAEAEAA
jgi:hypothetical protein